MVHLGMAQVPIGVYRTPEPDIAAIQAYEQFLGRQVDYVLAFMADAPSWTQFEQAILQSRTNGPPGTHSATEWTPLLASRSLCLGVPACVGNTSWADEANGKNDAHWQALARTLTAGGLGDADTILRIAREFQGGWPWKVTAANAADHKAGWSRIVAVMRRSDFAGKFMWNPYIGPFRPRAEVVSAYPGDSVVDMIGLDLYDGGYPQGEMLRTEDQQRAVWAGLRDQWDGLQGWVSFARTRKKPLAYPEWGLGLWNTAGVYSGGGDNPILIREMAAWMQNHGQNGPTVMHALWEDRGMGVSDRDDDDRRLVSVPRARAAFRECFGRKDMTGNG